jgi:hypothetical protein
MSQKKETVTAITFYCLQTDLCLCLTSGYVTIWNIWLQMFIHVECKRAVQKVKSLVLFLRYERALKDAAC